MCPNKDIIKFQNNQCVNGENLAFNQWSHCLNRQDVNENMFRENVFKKTRQPPNLSIQLNFDEIGIQCDEIVVLNWTIGDLQRLNAYGDIRECILKDSTKIY